jgi:hypothetical protein
MPKKIIAVAVGETANEVVVNNATPDFDVVRPYLRGLIHWLGLAPGNRTDPPQPDNSPPRYRIGTANDYTIVYRERPIDPNGSLTSLKSAFEDNTALNADLWLCMSTSVARAADAVAKAQAPTKPIVAIVSDPFSESFGNNVCGVSADRDRLAIRCLRQFRRRAAEAKNGSIIVLHREGYGPSDKARKWVGRKNVKGWIAIADSDDTQTMRQKIIDGTVNSPLPNPRAVLVLPADRLFGVAHQITVWTGPSIPTFWSTPDFPLNARGGFGYKQELCGQYMAERVAIIWKNQDAPMPPPDPFPDPKWETIEQTPANLQGRPDPLPLVTPSAKRSAKRPMKPSVKQSAKRPVKRRAKR